MGFAIEIHPSDEHDLLVISMLVCVVVQRRLKIVDVWHVISQFVFYFHENEFFQVPDQQKLAH